MEKDLDDMTLEELLDCLPNHLLVGRNDAAPVHDRYRLFNRVSCKYLESGFASVRELLADYETRRRGAERNGSEHYPYI